MQHGRQMSHDSFLESDSHYPPLHRNRPGSGPGEKLTSSIKQQLPDSRTRAHSNQNMSVHSTLVGGTHYSYLGATGEVVYRIILSQSERRHAKEFSLRSLEGTVDSDTGTRMVFWEFLWHHLSPSSSMLCRRHPIPKSPDWQGSPDPFQLLGM